MLNGASPISFNQGTKAKYRKMKIKLVLLFVISSSVCFSQTLTFKHAAHQNLYGKAWNLALWTIDTNTTKDGLLKAGAGYGGEWTRDASMNNWNAASLLRTKVAEHTLWSVTKNRDTVGHQYWDKIVWVISAWNHYCISGDKDFLAQAYKCARNTMAELEATAFNKQLNLFTGPGNINDGIAAYPEPVYEPNNLSSYVLDHKKSKEIMVLSTNLLYLEAYKRLMAMEDNFSNDNRNVQLKKKYDILRLAILHQFYDRETNSFYYIIYPNGSKVKMQEGLGYSYALLFNLLNQKEALALINNTWLSKFGIVNVYPHLPRYSDSLPGRHNNMVWAFINAYWAHAMAKYKQAGKFLFELNNQSYLALDADKGNNNFEEVANALTGKPDGGWQSNRQWSSKDHQTWNATGFCRTIINGMFGMEFTPAGISFAPCLPKELDEVKLQGIRYRDAIISITLRGSGTKIKSFVINDQQKKNFIPAHVRGEQNIVIMLK
jgi:hypothetical protein